jgi:hypothetical protein
MKLLCLVCVLACVACSQRHIARIDAANGPPPSIEMVRHSGDLYIELREHTPDRQCALTPGERKLCFDRVSTALGQSLEQKLWPSFRHVRVKRSADNLAPGDYLLLVDVELRPTPADDAGPGWSAMAGGKWQLVRDGIPLAGESIAARSRSEFYYGRSLGQGGSEVVAAIATHVATAVGQVPELRPERDRNAGLPVVKASNAFGPLSPAPIAAQARR